MVEYLDENKQKNKKFDSNIAIDFAKKQKRNTFWASRKNAKAKRGAINNSRI